MMIDPGLIARPHESAIRGAAVTPVVGKTRITIYIDDDIQAAFPCQAKGETEGIGFNR